MTDKKSGRYAVSADEDFEPGSNNEVLKNLLGIKSKDEIEILEEQELKRAEAELLEMDVDHQFSAADICNMHELWLGDIYAFAGKYRSVDMSKDGFPFAHAGRIDVSMFALERDFLSKYTPCKFLDDELAKALGIVHVELILIHPFREGNGRIARLLADLMAMQAGRPSLNYTAIDQNDNPGGFKDYILAIHAGVSGNYEPIRKIFRMLLDQSS